MLASLGAAVAGSPSAPRRSWSAPAATGLHLLVVVSAERGLSGAFNTNVSRLARARARELESQGKTVRLLTVGRKGTAFLKRELADRFAGEVSFAGQKSQVGFEDAAESVAVRMITEMLERGEFDVCLELIYNRFGRASSARYPPCNA